VTADRTEYETEGGDPVCWMHLLCPSCGAMPDPDEPTSTTCPRCGEERDR
jgi:ribosomal protein S27AE